MKLLENKIRKMVAECVEEHMLREAIREMVREAIMTEDEEDNKGEGPKKKAEGGKKESQKQFRALAKKHIVNSAPLAYKLFPEMGKDAARSYLSKIIRGERPISNTEANQGIQMIHQMQG